MVSISIRSLARDTGVTVSACRHALKLLMSAGLLTRTAGTWTVKKWVEEQQITTRAKTKRDMQEQIQALERKMQQEKLQKQSEERQNFDYDDPQSKEAYERIKKKFGL